MNEIIKRFEEKDVIVIDGKYYTGIVEISNIFGIDYNVLYKRIQRLGDSIKMIELSTIKLYELDEYLCNIIQSYIIKQSLKRNKK